MLECWFEIKDETTERWMVRVMNFGQNRPYDKPKTKFKMIVDKSLINELTQKDLLDIKHDAENFPDDWDGLGSILLALKNPTFYDVEKADGSIAQKYIFEFGYDILILLEMHYKNKLKAESVDYILNSVDVVAIEKDKIIITGEAFITGN